MKKIIAFLILLLCLKQSYAQYPLKQFLGSDSTLVTVRGGMNARLVLWSFTDTTQANTQRISQYAGALIYTTGTDKVWYRNSTATGWIEFTSSGGTTTNIYNSDGFITGTRVLDLSASPLAFSRSGVKQFAAEDNLTTIGSPNNEKRITVYNDSITILGLSQTTDTTTYKPLAIDGNGYFTIMDRWPGGGGSSGWALTGNAGTDIATNFIGTTDSVAFLLKVNNLLAGQMDINQKNTSFGQEALLNRNTGGTNNVAIGYRALNKLTNADNNVAVGRMSLGNLTSGNQNTAVGVSALSSIIAQVGNTAIGYQSQLNSTAQINTSVGHSSLLNNTSGVSNTAMGYQAMFSNTTGGANTVMGEGSLYNNTTGSNNTAIGYQALSGTADYNTSVGSQSLRSNISGGFNTSVGYYSLGDNTTGYSNAAIGMNAGRFNTTGFQNSFIGTAAGEDNTTGQENTFVGYDAGLKNTTGIRNTSLGWNGFANNFTGGQNVGIGYGAGKTITNGDNNTILGAFAAWDTPQNDTIQGRLS